MYIIPKEYLVRSLIHAYRNFIRVYLTKESSGWRNYQTRLESLKYEILLLNYSINQGTPLQISKQYINKNQFVQWNDLIDFINKLQSKNDPKLMDTIYLTKRKIKSEYNNKFYNYLPLLDPFILDLGIVMKGIHKGARSKRKLARKPKPSDFAAYYIVKAKKGKHVWADYQPHSYPVSVYLPNEILYFIYGRKI